MAAISVGPSGVRVDPVWDVTKIALASFTTLGAMFMMFSRLQAAGWRLGRREIGLGAAGSNNGPVARFHHG